MNILIQLEQTINIPDVSKVALINKTKIRLYLYLHRHIRSEQHIATSYKGKYTKENTLALFIVTISN